MNATAITRRIARPAARLIAGLVAAFAVLMGLVGPASAATGWQWHGKVATNNFYGYVSGDTYITSDNARASVYVHHRDVRDDGACSVAQARVVFSTGQVSNPARVGNNCSTSTNNYSIKHFYAASGWYFTNVQVRTCQSDRYGSVIGTCSGWVTAGQWARESFSY